MNNNLLSLMQKNIDSALNNVMIKVQTALLEHIDKYVYSPDKPEYYKRQRTRNYGGKGFGSRGTWPVKGLKKNSKEISKAILYDYLAMTAPGDMSLNNGDTHGYGGGARKSAVIDRREDLIWILNDRMYNAVYSDWATEGAVNVNKKNTHYWDEFIDYLDSNIFKWIDEELKKYGISRG